MRNWFGALIAMAWLASPIEAAVVANITEDANGFYANFAGSLDLTGTFQDTPIGFRGGQMFGNGVDQPTFGFGQKDFIVSGWLFPYATTVLPSDIMSGPGQFGPGSSADTGSGDVFFLFGGRVGVQQSYVSNTFMSGSSTWNKPGAYSDIASSYLNEGRYLFNVPSGDTITINIGNTFAQTLPSPVPIGPSGLLLFSGLCFFAAVRRSRLL